MSEQRFDRMRRQIEGARRVVENSEIRADSPDFDTLLDLKLAVYTVMEAVIELADEAEKAAFGKYAEGRSVTA